MSEKAEDLILAYAVLERFPDTWAIFNYAIALADFVGDLS